MSLNFDSNGHYKGKGSEVYWGEGEGKQQGNKGIPVWAEKELQKTNLIGKSYHFNFWKKKQNTSASLTSRNTVLKIEDMIREKLKFHGKLI